MADALLFASAVAGVVAAGGVVGLLGGRARARERLALAERRSARSEADRLRAAAAAEAQTLVREAEIAAREDALALRGAAEVELRTREEELARLRAALVAREADATARERELGELKERLAAREAPIAGREREAAAHRRAATASAGAVQGELERVAGERAADLSAAIRDGDIERARATAAQLLRQTDASVGDPEQVRWANRILAIAVGRFSGHYLTERHLSTLPIGEPRQGRPTIAAADLEAISATAGVRLTLSDGQDAVRLEGLDGVGREIARRCVARLLKRPGTTGDAVVRVAKEIAGDVDREVVELGRRAFSVLEIPRAHPDIVKLVGRLNWRTSYTQNQWKHAIESAFLCGMMAEELGLDVKLARRAALMHDIGKALTHELDGSHAVIGADYARRLGEREVVANAIGAHHTDEPFGSAYAYLVAAADAMSGARPGARRQTEDNYVAKIADLERLSRSFAGVAEAFAVQGGREVRVFVKEDRVDDLGAVNLSSQIATRISNEMTFPGQIRVTVIREFKAVETAS
jgi:ribonuclease Y